jgi:RHS repeat-associated protein
MISMTDEYGVHNYVYDALYRLTQATHPQPTNPLEQFNYDPVGNRLDTSVYNAANQLLEDESFTYSYDKNGNTISKTNKVTGEYTRYHWNAENQMTGLEKYAQAGDTTPTSTISYIYDGLGRRVAKNIDGVITKYIYDQEDILLETDDNDNVLARYTHGPGIDEPISMERNGSNYYYVADGLGSIVKLVDAAGATVNNYVYDSFGNMLEKTEGVANPYTYTAREYDAESGLYYYRLRYYNAGAGRFLSKDPIHSRPFKPCASSSSIQVVKELNKYIYGLNNPLKLKDPLGLWSTANDILEIARKTTCPKTVAEYDEYLGCEDWKRKMREANITHPPEDIAEKMRNANPQIWGWTYGSNIWILPEFDNETAAKVLCHEFLHYLNKIPPDSGYIYFKGVL